MGVLSIRVPIRNKSGNLYAPCVCVYIYIYIYIYIYGNLFNDPHMLESQRLFQHYIVSRTPTTFKPIEEKKKKKKKINIF